jgi:hypothetical protein
MWRPDWAHHHAVPEVGINLFGTVFTVVWVVFCLPAALSLVPDLAAYPTVFWLLAAGVPVMAVAMVVHSLHDWIRVFLARTHPLVLKSHPAKPGKRFRGLLRIPATGLRQWEAEVVCNYIKDTRMLSGRLGHTELCDELWRQVVEPAVVRGRRSRYLEIAVKLPEGFPDTGPHQRGRIEWLVQVRGYAASSRPRHVSSYTIPVYHAPLKSGFRAALLGESRYDSRAPAAERTGTSEAGGEGGSLVASGPGSRLEKAGIHVSETGAVFEDQVWWSSTSVRFAMRVALISLILSLLLLGLFSIHLVGGNHMAMLVLALGAIVSMGFLGLSMFSLAHRFHVQIDSSNILVRHRCLGWRWSRQLAWRDIRKIATDIDTSMSDDEERLCSVYIAAYPRNKQLQPLVLSPGLGEYRLASELLDWFRKKKILFAE